MAQNLRGGSIIPQPSRKSSSSSCPRGRLGETDLCRPAVSVRFVDDRTFHGERGGKVGCVEHRLPANDREDERPCRLGGLVARLLDQRVGDAIDGIRAGEKNEFSNLGLDREEVRSPAGILVDVTFGQG